MIQYPFFQRDIIIIPFEGSKNKEKMKKRSKNLVFFPNNGIFIYERR